MTKQFCPHHKGAGPHLRHQQDIFGNILGTGETTSKPSSPMRLAGSKPHCSEATRSGRALGQGLSP